MTDMPISDDSAIKKKKRTGIVGIDSLNQTSLAVTNVSKPSAFRKEALSTWP